MDLIAESNRQYYLAWRLMAESSPRGTVVKGADYAITCAGVPIPLFNTAFVFGPVTKQRLVAITDTARDYFQKQQVPGCLVLPDPWHPESALGFFESRGMPAALRTTGMFAESFAPPAHALPKCNVEELSGDEAAIALAVVNTDAYGMDPRAAEIMTLPKLWTPPVTRSYAVMQRGKPVAVGAAAVLEGISYIMWMATLTDARRKGFAEVIIRRALADTGTARTVLHATGPGFPVYKRLGYVPVADFPGYVFP